MRGEIHGEPISPGDPRLFGGEIRKMAIDTATSNERIRDILNNVQIRYGEIASGIEGLKNALDKQVEGLNGVFEAISTMKQVSDTLEKLASKTFITGDDGMIQ